MKGPEEIAAIYYDLLSENDRPSSVKALEYTLAKHIKTKLLNFDPITDSQLAVALEKNGLNELILEFGHRPDLLVRILKIFREELALDLDVIDFANQYEGIRTSPRMRRSRRPDAVSNGSESNLIRDLAVFNKTFTRKKSESAYSERFEYQLLVSLFSREFENNSEQALADLEASAGELDKPEFAHVPDPIKDRLKNSYRKVQAEFFETLKVKIEGLRVRAFPFQKHAILEGLKKDNLILGDEPGLGKTLQALGIAENYRPESGRKILTLWVTNKTNSEPFHDELLLLTKTNDSQILNLSPLTTDERVRELRNIVSGANELPKYLIIHPEALVGIDEHWRSILNERVDMIVVDEAQMLDSPDTQRTNAINDFVKAKKILLTASPYQSDPARLFNVLNFIAPRRFGISEAGFQTRYLSSRAGLRELEVDMSTFLIRRVKEQVANYVKPLGQQSAADQIERSNALIPKKVEAEAIEFQLSREQNLAYVDAVSRPHVYAKKTGQESDNGYGHFQIVQFLYQIEGAHQIFRRAYGASTSPRTEALKARLASVLKDGEKAIVFTERLASATDLARDLAEYDPMVLNSTVSSVARRNEIIENFQDKTHPSQILILSYGVGSTSLNLSAATHVLFAELPFNFIKIYQAGSRAERIYNQSSAAHIKEDVHFHHVVARLDENILAEARTSGFSNL